MTVPLLCQHGETHHAAPILQTKLKNMIKQLLTYDRDGLIIKDYKFLARFINLFEFFENQLRK